MLKIIATLSIIFIMSCGDKVKTNQEKVIGSWKRDLINGMGGQKISTDTVLITNSTIKFGTTTYNYYLKSNILYYIQNTDTNSYCFDFISETNMKWTCFASPSGNYFNLIKY